MLKLYLMPGTETNYEKMVCHLSPLPFQSHAFPLFAREIIEKTGISMYDGNQVLIDYLTETLDGVVSEKYADPYGEGRIRIIEKPEEAAGSAAEEAVSAAEETGSAAEEAGSSAAEAA